MGILKFKLPANMHADDVQELKRACIAGAQDFMPFPTEVNIHADHFSVRRSQDESGFLLVPWEVNGVGRLMFQSATLMERDQAYRLAVEIARGKLNQVRVQSCEWDMGGVPTPRPLHEQIQQATLLFGKAIHGPQPAADLCAQKAIVRGCELADQLVDSYAEQLLKMRHDRHAKLSTMLGCRVNGMPNEVVQAQLTQACNAVWLPFRWSVLEPEEGSFNWDQMDALVAWASSLDMQIIGGPLLDFFGADWPDWLWQEQRSLSNVGSFFCQYVEAVVNRYRTTINTWHVSASSNLSPGLAIGDEELLWLTLRAAESVRQVNPAFQIIIGVAQPWGEYLTEDERTHSPFAFADTLVRTGLKLAALDLEVVMAVTPRGSYCRDLLDLSRVLDLYALLGAPLQLTVGYPASTEADPQADFRLNVGGGRWREGVSPKTQAEWARQVIRLALCKPYVRSVGWAHLHDARPHEYPNCGLIDANDEPRPALDELRKIRAAHLK